MSEPSTIALGASAASGVPAPSETAFVPSVLVFCCNWCAYAGADLAGVSRRQISPHFRVIRTLCSARVDPEFILHAFKQGADGVMVLGCHPGDCHYIGGNYRTRRRMALLKAILLQFGLHKDRFRLEWVSAAEGEKFAQVVNEFVEHVARLGPSPYRVHAQRAPIYRTAGEGGPHG